MNEQEQAALLLERCRRRMSGKEIEYAEAIVQEHGIPTDYDPSSGEWFELQDYRNLLTRLCTEFAEAFK